jgi:steroid delta-isomerase-like uncharacterized protein
MTAIELAHVETVRHFYEDVLNRNHLDLLPSLLSEAIAFHGASEEHGIEAYKALVARLRVAFPDQHFTLHDMIASADRVAVRWTMDATHSGPLAGIPATGKRVQQRANVIYRFEDEKIAEVWAQMDQVGMLRQLGIDPLPARSQANGR